MKPLYAKSISCYAADTAGVCSALFELGGMTVVHDASGCNSTYATHDEPRWFKSASMTYISALTESDVVCGNDRKLIDDVVRAARELHPEFIALCNSPIPLMVGCDMQAIADEIEAEGNIIAFAVKTSGMNHYWQGASDAFLALAKRFLQEKADVRLPRRVNILGATPLDFSLNGNVEAVADFLHQHDFTVQSTWAMNNTLAELQQSVYAELNLVIAASGLALAEYMFEKYDIPFVVGLPLGVAGAEALAQTLEKTLLDQQSKFWCAERTVEPAAQCAIIGESVFAGSLAKTLQAERSWNCVVIDPLTSRKCLLSNGDLQLESEGEIADVLKQFSMVIADNMYNPIIPSGCKVINIPHEAFSGRCYHKARLNLINKKVEWENHICRK